VFALRWNATGPIGLAGRAGDGTIRYYAGDGTGGFADPAGTQIGSGFEQYGSVSSLGDWSGDDVADLIAVRGDGTMWLYTPTGTGGWGNNGQGREIGQGWDGYTVF
jgi:hypothetical protein